MRKNIYNIKQSDDEHWDTHNKSHFKKFLKVVAISLLAIAILFATSIFASGFFLRPPEIPAAALLPVLAAPPLPEPPAPDPNPPPIVEHPIVEEVEIIVEEPQWNRRENFFTLLVFGTDDGINTDTMMVASYCANTGEAHVISIPRDTQVALERIVRRINSAYAIGYRQGGHANGVARLKYEISTLIGFKPDFYVYVQLEAFERIIDAVGGVEIHVPFRMIYNDPTQGLHINLYPGLQRLDGKNALHFARYRLGDEYYGTPTISDTRRMEHQQMVVRAMLDELLSPRTVLRIPELIRTYRHNVSTDLSLTEMLWFARSIALNFDSLGAHMYPVTGRLTGTPTGTRWYAFPHEDEALELINATINPFDRDITSDLLWLTEG